MTVLICFAMNTVVLRRISILYDKYYQYINRAKIETPMFYLLARNKRLNKCCKNNS